MEECKFEVFFFLSNTQREPTVFAKKTHKFKYSSRSFLWDYFGTQINEKNQDRSSLCDLKFTDDGKTSTADFQSLMSSRETACTPGPFAPGSQPRGSSEPPGRFQGRRAAVPGRLVLQLRFRRFQILKYLPGSPSPSSGPRSFPQCKAQSTSREAALGTSGFGSSVHFRVLSLTSFPDTVYVTPLTPPTCPSFHLHSPK